MLDQGIGTLAKNGHFIFKFIAARLMPSEATRHILKITQLLPLLQLAQIFETALTNRDLAFNQRDIVRVNFARCAEALHVRDCSLSEPPKACSLFLFLRLEK